MNFKIFYSKSSFIRFLSSIIIHTQVLSAFIVRIVDFNVLKKEIFKVLSRSYTCNVFGGATVQIEHRQAHW